MTAKLSILSINSDKEKEKEEEEGEEEREEEGTDFMLTDSGARSKYAVMRVFSSSPSLPSLTSNTIELPAHHKHDSKLSLTDRKRKHVENDIKSKSDYCRLFINMTKSKREATVCLPISNRQRIDEVNLNGPESILITVHPRNKHKSISFSFAVQSYHKRL